MVEETYSAFEIEGNIIEAENNLDNAVTKIKKNGKKYEYSREMISSYKSLAKEIMYNVKRLRKLIKEMEVFDEEAFKRRGKELDRRVDII